MIKNLVMQTRRPGKFNALYALLPFILFLFAGCEGHKEPDGLGSIAGIAELAEPDAATGNAGVLVFLAGTSFQARTDTQGRYRIDGVPQGTYDLVAEKEGYAGKVFNAVMVNPVENGPEKPLLAPRATLEKKSAEPIAGAASALGTIVGSVFLHNAQPEENGGIRVEVNNTPFVTVTSSDGKYRILNVEPGQYTLSYFKDGYRPYTTEKVSITTGVIQIDDQALELVQAGDKVSPVSAATAAVIQAAAGNDQPPPGPDEKRSIIGGVQLRDASNQVITDYSDVTIAINGTSLIAELNEQGQFRFDDLTSGIYTLLGKVGDGPVVQQIVDLESQRSATVMMKLGGPQEEVVQDGRVIIGRVVLVDGQGKDMPDASGVQISVPGTQVSASSDAQGNFKLAGLPLGTYTIEASKAEFEGAKATDIALTADADADAGVLELTMKVDRPRVLSTVPALNEKDVAVGFDLPITVKFSQKMDPAALRGAVSVTPSTPFSIAFGNGAAPGADDSTMIIQLSNDNSKSPIQFGAGYRITIAESAANFAGVTMAEPYVLTFRTANPGVIQTYPAQNANNAYVDQNNSPVYFVFNTRLDPDTINERNIRVKPDNGISVSTTFTDSDTNGWTTVRVSTQWQPNTPYTITISRRVKAKNGQALGNTPYTLRFRSAPLEIMTMPIMTKR